MEFPDIDVDMFSVKEVECSIRDAKYFVQICDSTESSIYCFKTKENAISFTLKYFGNLTTRDNILYQQDKYLTIGVFENDSIERTLINTKDKLIDHLLTGTPVKSFVNNAEITVNNRLFFIKSPKHEKWIAHMDDKRLCIEDYFEYKKGTKCTEIKIQGYVA